MYVKNFHNLANNKLEKVTYYQKVQILTAYLEVCKIAGTKPDSIYKVKDVDNITLNDLKYIISFITIYNNIQDIYDDKSLTRNWFTRAQRQKPFNNKHPLELIKEDKVNILKLKLYTNSLRVHLWEIMDKLKESKHDRR